MQMYYVAYAAHLRHDVFVKEAAFDKLVTLHCNGRHRHTAAQILH